MAEYRVYAGNYGATIGIDGKFVYCASKCRHGVTTVAFVQSGSRWRPVEWFTVPQAVKDALFDKAIAKAGI